MSETKKSDFPSDLGAWYMKAWKDAVNNEHCGPKVGLTENKMSETKKHREWTLIQAAMTTKHGHIVPECVWLGPDITEDTRVVEASALLEEKQKVEKLERIIELQKSEYNDLLEPHFVEKLNAEKQKAKDMFELIKAVKQVLLKTQRLEKESIMESHGNPGLDGCGQITISTYVDDSLNRLNELIKKHRGENDSKD